MRKMTKTVAVLAAMSAMTVASASLAFAAEDQIKNVSSIAKSEDAQAGAVSGTWNSEAKDEWSFTVDGKKLKNTWAEIDGVWYYFDGDKMVQDRIMDLDGDFYYFDENGRLATGWQKISSDSEAYSDLEISAKLTKASNISSQENAAYAYSDYAWCYFDENGKAAENEWVQSEAGLWYYFDELVMVMDIYNYEIELANNDNDGSKFTETYGFDKNGAMLVGWNYKEGSTTKNNPTADAKGKTWFYYNTNGKMQKAGWKKIGENWYLFANENVASNEGLALEGAYPLIINSFVDSIPKVGAAPEYFYVDDAGKMQTGVVTLPKKINLVSFYIPGTNDEGNAVVKTDSTYRDTVEDSGKPEIYFGTKGAATEALVNGRYYTLSDLTEDVVVTVVDFDDVINVSNTSINVKGATSFAVTGYYDVTDDDGNLFYGRVIKSGFIGVEGDELYLADEDGDIMKNEAVLVKTNVKADGTTEDVYVLFDRYGEAYTGYENKNKSVKIGNKTYWSTGDDMTISGVEVSTFKLNKTN